MDSTLRNPSFEFWSHQTQAHGARRKASAPRPRCAAIEAQLAGARRKLFEAYGYELPANKAHQYVLSTAISNYPEDVIRRVHWISKDINELAELPDGTASCAFSFWVGIPLATQEKILSLCAASLSIWSVCVYGPFAKWRAPEDGEV